MFELVLQSGPVVKLVLLILVYFSLVSWAIIFYKFTIVLKAIKESDRLIAFFWSKKRFDVVGQGKVCRRVDDIMALVEIFNNRVKRIGDLVDIVAKSAIGDIRTGVA